MTSLSRRKHPTTARRTTARRTTCSLLGLAWLAAGTAVADPAPLRPIAGPALSAELRDPPPLMPFLKTTLPEVAAPIPAAAPVAPPAPAKTFYYQKDAARPAPPPMPQPAPAPSLAVNYQAPDVIQPQTGVPTLPSGAIRYDAPGISDIPLQSDAALRQTIVAEAEKQYKTTDNIYKNFPTNYYDHPGVNQTYAPRVFVPSAMRVEANYLCYGRLYFEDKNSERYGWELGPLQPFVSTLKFYKDVLSLPYNYGTRPCQRFEANAGYCLPGDPVPYLIYPVEASLTGGLLEAGTIVGLYAIFP